MVLDDAVLGSWTELAQRLDDSDRLTWWAASEPVLADVSAVAALPALLAPGVDRGVCDALVGALVRVAASDPDAVLVVVHLLGEGIAATAARLRDLSPDITWLLVGALAVQIRVFSQGGRSRICAKTLLMGARTQVLREFGIGRGSAAGHRGLERAVDPFVLAVTGQGRLAHDDDGGDDPVSQVADFRAWACRRGVATTGDVDLLLDLQRQRGLGHGHGGRHAVAARYGVGERTVRRRRDAALASLRAAVPEYLAALA